MRSAAVLLICFQKIPSGFDRDRNELQLDLAKARNNINQKRYDEAESLLAVIENSTSGHGRLLPEQVWDAADLPALELFRGKPTG